MWSVALVFLFSFLSPSHYNWLFPPELPWSSHLSHGGTQLTHWWSPGCHRISLFCISHLPPSPPQSVIDGIVYQWCKTALAPKVHLPLYTHENVIWVPDIIHCGEEDSCKQKVLIRFTDSGPHPLWLPSSDAAQSLSIYSLAAHYATSWGYFWYATSGTATLHLCPQLQKGITPLGVVCVCEQNFFLLSSFKLSYKNTSS